MQYSKGVLAYRELIDKVDAFQQVRSRESSSFHIYKKILLTAKQSIKKWLECGSRKTFKMIEGGLVTEPHLHSGHGTKLKCKSDAWPNTTVGTFYGVILTEQGKKMCQVFTLNVSESARRHS